MPRLLKEEEGKRYSLSAKTSLETNLAIKAAAQKAGRSVSQEIEFRLEKSFALEKHEEALSRNEVSKSLDKESIDLVRSMEASIGAVLLYTRKSWQKDIYTRVAVKAAIDAVRVCFFQGHGFEQKIETVDRDAIEKAASLGTTFGNMLSRPAENKELSAMIENTGKTSLPFLKIPHLSAQDKYDVSADAVRLSDALREELSVFAR